MFQSLALSFSRAARTQKAVGGEGGGSQVAGLGAPEPGRAVPAGGEDAQVVGGEDGDSHTFLQLKLGPVGRELEERGEQPRRLAGISEQRGRLGHGHHGVPEVFDPWPGLGAVHQDAAPPSSGLGQSPANTSRIPRCRYTVDDQKPRIGRGTPQYRVGLSARHA